MTKLVAAPLRSVKSQPPLSRDEQNQYISRLKTLCQQVNMCAIRDIDGNAKTQWAKKGDTLTKSHFESDTVQRLTVDFDRHIHIEGQITEESLIGHFKLMIEAEPHLKDFADKHHSEELLSQLCKALTPYPSLLTKLTCLSYTFPYAFKSALFTAWLGVSTAQIHTEVSTSYQSIFLSAILQGLGLLFLPATIQFNDKSLTTEQRLELQNYPKLGYTLLANCDGLEPEVAKTVLEHREHLDGSGYPSGKLGRNICPSAQLLNVLSSLYAAYNYRLKPAKRPLSCLISIIKMNGHTRFGRTGLQLIEVLKDENSEYQATLPLECMSSFIGLVKNTFTYLKECVSIAENTSIEIGFRHNNPQLYALQNRIIHVDISVTQSEVINEAYLRWLGHIEKNQIAHAYGEVEDTFLRMHEVAFHIEKLKHAMAIFLELKADDVTQEAKTAVREGLTKLEAVIEPAIPPVLLSTWVAVIAEKRHESL